MNKTDFGAIYEAAKKTTEREKGCTITDDECFEAIEDDIDKLILRQKIISQNIELLKGCREYCLKKIKGEI